MPDTDDNEPVLDEKALMHDDAELIEHFRRMVARAVREGLRATPDEVETRTHEALATGRRP